MKSIIRTVLVKHKVYAIINVLGFGIGFSICLFCYLVSLFDLGYDTHAPDHRHVFRLESVFIQGDREDPFAVSARSLGPELMERFPEVVNYGRLSMPWRQTIQLDDDVFYTDRLLSSDQNTIQLFGYEFLLGNPGTALANRDEAILTESTARRWFGSLDKAIGQLVEVDEKHRYQVVGVIKDLPKNSHVHFEGLVSIQNELSESLVDQKEEDRLLNLWSAQDYVFVRLAAGVNVDEFFTKVNKFIDREIAGIMRSYGMNERFQLSHTPIRDTHYRGGFSYNQPIGSWSYTRVTVLIGFFLLVVVGANFNNLSLALFSSRTKELLTRSIVGASRAQLIRMILIESLSYVFLGLGVAYLTVIIFIESGLAMAVIGRGLDWRALTDPLFLVSMVISGGLFGGVSCIQTALSVSKTSITDIHKMKLKVSGLRSLLFSLQFLLSIVTLAWMLLMGRQIAWIDDHELGMSVSDVIVVSRPDDGLNQSTDALIDQWMEIPDIESVSQVTLTNDQYVIGVFNLVSDVESEQGEMRQSAVNYAFVGDSFVKTFGVGVSSGRDFLIGDKYSKVLVNEAFRREMGWSEPIGKNIKVKGKQFEVIGVVADFHFKSLRESVEPIALLHRESLSSEVEGAAKSSFHIALAGDLHEHTIEEIKSSFENHYPEKPFEYGFIDNKLEALYASDRQQFKTLKLMSLVGIAITVMSLFGLISFQLNQRLPELAVRITLGARVVHVWYVLVRRYILPIVGATTLSMVICYILLNAWLANFAYHIPIVENLVLAVAIGSLSMFLVATITVWFRLSALRRLKPSEVLRNG